jgi:hypothetical protein
MSEYFMKLRFYLDINKKTDILRELEDEITGEIIDEKIDIDDKITKKYKQYLKDDEIKTEYTDNDDDDS